MDVRRGKRLKLDNGHAALSKNASPADLDENNLRKVTVYPDVNNLFTVLQYCGMSRSPTIEYEGLHAQRMQMTNLLSATMSAARSIGQDHEHTEKVGIPADVQREEEEDGIVLPIEVCSADEHRGRNIKEMKSSSTDQIRDLKGWLRSRIKLHASGAKLYARDGHLNYCHYFLSGKPVTSHYPSAEGKGTLSIIKYENAVRKTVIEEQSTHQYANNWRRVKRGKRNEEEKSSVAGGDKGGKRNNEETSSVAGGDNGGKRKDEEKPSFGGGGRGGKRKAEEKSSVVGSVKGGRFVIGCNMKEKAGDISPTFVENGDCLPHNQDNLETLEKVDPLDDLWRDMSIAMECSKDATALDVSAPLEAEEDLSDCNHSFLLDDEVGLVCRVCGVVQKSIDSIFDYQWTKGKQSIRTYVSEPKRCEVDGACFGERVFEQILVRGDVSIHPRHMKQMKPHQIEGFNFLVKNLLADTPGGCILAHAPGSGKTFMLLSFIQSFMAKHPNARPLIVLPKGILATWRNEYERWKIEDIPLYDFYSSKAESRPQQLEILNRWHEKRSILLLGYKQFSNIICEYGGNKVTEACQDKLLRVPTLLILDEGHNPRNDETDMVGSLAKVRTPCKVVLSGTLFQNHVEEVFNILKLVRPNFMKTESSRIITKRIRSMGIVPSGRRVTKSNPESYFYELVEETLRNDENYKRKISIIQELRDMTRGVLHYYKGDFLDELPGLVDFTVLLNISKKQKDCIQNLGKLDKFRQSSMEKVIYMHPQLLKLKEDANGYKDSIDIRKVDSLIGSIDVRDGVKAKFFMNLLTMAQSSGEKLLVFSQYLLPLKFLERLVLVSKGWRLGKEVFVIYGDTSPEDRESSMEQFNNSADAKVFFGSIKACGEGISLVGASRILILDVHLNPSVTRQAIGRAFRPGQKKKVFVYRLVAADSQEEEDHKTSCRKELISKMWFEWSEHLGHQDFDLAVVDPLESEDMLFDNFSLREDIRTLYKR